MTPLHQRLRRVATPGRVLVGLLLVAAVVVAGWDAGGDGSTGGPPATVTAASPVPPAASPVPPAASPVPPAGAAGRAAGAAASIPGGVPADAQRARVVNVVDGDTINVEPTAPGDLSTDAAHTIRLLLVDTPETVDPTRPVGCYGREASRYVTDRLLGETVWLEADEQDTDRYGRFLRHVWLDDGTNFNLQLVAGGFADAVLYEPNDRYWPRFADAAQAARARAVGQWGACGGTAAAADGVTATAAPERAGAACDASYPDVCIPPPPPDLDCGAIDHRRFTVTGADPHDFDGNDDGVGCEEG